MNSDRILALDIGTSGLKLAEFLPGKSGSVELINFAVGSLGLGPGDDDERSKALTATVREMMREQQMKPGPVLLTVSGQAVFSRFVMLPPVDKDKISKIVAYEAQQNVPFPIEEVVWDYQLIGSGDDGLGVMLAAIKGEIIESITASVEAAGLIPDLVDVAPMAMYNAARYNNADAAGCTLLIDIGARSTDLVFLEPGHVFIRSIPIAGNAMTQQISRELKVSFEEAEELKLEHAFVGVGGSFVSYENETKECVSKIVRNVMTRMHTEINRSINFYRGQQNGSKPIQVLLAGGSSVVPGAERFFSEKLQVPVNYFNPFENVAVSDAVETSEIAENVSVLGQTVGLALRRVLTCPIEINLIPARVLADNALRRRRPILILSAMGLALVMLVWTCAFYKMTGLTEKRYGIVRQQAQTLQSFQSQIDEQQKEIDEVQERIKTIFSLMPRRSFWNEVLTEMRSLIPDGMWLVSLKTVEVDRVASGGADQMAGKVGARKMGRNPIGVNPDSLTQRVEAIEIAGIGYLDKMKSSAPILHFRDLLRLSPYFSDETEITWQPRPTESSVTREFKITVILEEPMR